MATDTSGVTRLYAADFIGGKIDVFDANFKPMNPGAFTDRYLPRGYAPFNITAIEVNGATRMFVTYAINDLSNIFGQGHGVVNSFALDGTQATRFAQHGQLDAPWAVVTTPRTFGGLDRQGNVALAQSSSSGVGARLAWASTNRPPKRLRDSFTSSAWSSRWAAKALDRRKAASRKLPCADSGIHIVG
jgi:hypothetical protein